MALCLQCVSNSEVGIIERLGKFTGLASPGLNCILWPIDVVSYTSASWSTVRAYLVYAKEFKSTVFFSRWQHAGVQ